MIWSFQTGGLSGFGLMMVTSTSVWTDFNGRRWTYSESEFRTRQIMLIYDKWTASDRQTDEPPIP